MRVLLIEDDESLGHSTRQGLIQHGYTVDWLRDGTAADQALQQSETFDVIILDLGLPNLSGITVLQQMRDRGDITPVLILTARDTAEDRVAGLDSGADDYLVKPFDFNELLARLRALQRRIASRAAPLLKYNDIVLDPAAHSLSYQGQPVMLSRREFALLQVLLENVGRVLSRERLTQTLYGWGEEIDSNALEVHIHNLRKRFGQTFIKTIRGVGYVIASHDNA